MWWKVKWVILWSLWAGRVVRQPTAPVLTSSGLVRGSVAHSGTHAHYMAIPYATLNGRFQAPGPEPKWEGVFEAIEDNIRCRQTNSLRGRSATGTENCMTLNIFQPLNNPPDKLLPVMMFIHGGAFLQGSGSRMIFGPEYLTTKGVVLVTINYRLNAQGFLCLGIKEAPGNAGMKDQVAALKWVKRNIKAFGGDPDNVTLFGESAGATSVSAHIASPMSNGLFHKAIIQSGTSLASTVIPNDPVHIASLHAKALGFESKNVTELYDFFKKQKDDDLIVHLFPRAENTTVMSEITYSPCVEQIVDGEEAFLTDHPYNILTNGKQNKVPMIIGANAEEGIYFMSMDVEHFIDSVDFEKSLPKDLIFPSNDERRKVANEVKGLYMGGDDISKGNKLKLSKFYGEPHVNYPIVLETELLVNTSDQPIYHYLFRYETLRNIAKKTLSSEYRAGYGATHADELFYLFSQQVFPSFFQSEMIHKMSTMWTNFAKYGNPTPPSNDIGVQWPPVTRKDKRALLIDSQVTTVPLWYSKSLLFWKDVYSKYRRKY